MSKEKNTHEAAGTTLYGEKDLVQAAKKNVSSEEKNDSEENTPGRTVSKKRMFLLGGVIIIILLLLDQFTKYFAIHSLKNNPPIILLQDILHLEYVENTGSAFSLFQGQRGLILLMGIIILAAAVFFLYKLPTDRKFCITHILVSVMIAGALGNMIDRIRYGFVVDFISFVLIHFPVFNIADCFVVISALSLFVLFMFVYKEKDLKWINSVLK